MSDLFILGAGQYGKYVKSIAEELGVYQRVFFLDDNEESAVGILNEFLRYKSENAGFCVAIGNPEVRLRYINGLLEQRCKIENIVARSAYVSTRAKVGVGVIVEPNVSVLANANVGTGVLLRAGSVIDHDAKVGNGCNVNCGTVVRANSTMKDGYCSSSNEVI